MVYPSSFKQISIPPKLQPEVENVTRHLRNVYVGSSEWPEYTIGTSVFKNIT